MNKSARGWVIFGVIAFLGIGVAACAGSNAASPRDYIKNQYDCDADPTNNDRATCDATDSPGTVASEISSDTRPVDEGRASEDVSTYDCDSDYASDYTSDPAMCDEAEKSYDDQTVYMQYEDDIVVVAQDGSGTKVDVYDYDDGYRSHSSHFAVFGWTSSRPSTSSGGGSGGFGGFGK